MGLAPQGAAKNPLAYTDARWGGAYGAARMMTTKPSEVHEITASTSMGAANGREGERCALRWLFMSPEANKGGAEDVEEFEFEWVYGWVSNIAFPESFSDSILNY